MARSAVIRNLTRGTLLADRCVIAAGYLERMLGLIPRARLVEGEGLLLLRTSAITMFFMRFAIDAVALDAQGTVVACWRGLRPWSPIVGARRAASVLELPVGTIERTATVLGDVVRIDAAQVGAVRET